MTPDDFDLDYWQARWNTEQTQWDTGAPTTPLKMYIDGLADRKAEILIPGCGNAYEGEYLFEKGFTRTRLIDIAPAAVQRIKERAPLIPDEAVILGDFFAHEGQYDFIIEQTFFCALHPSLRRRYAEKMHSLLKPGGKLVGVLFEDILFEDHPPFGGEREEYRTYFETLFEMATFERCRNSIPPRAGRELFIQLVR